MNNGQNEVIELLRELLKWTRVGFYSSVKGTLEAVLADEKRKLIYHLADGSRTVEEIRKAASTSPNKVIELFRACEALGLMSSLATGQRVKLFELEHFSLMPSDSSHLSG